MSTHDTVLVAGDGGLTAAIVRDLETAGVATEWLHHPSDAELSATLARGPVAVAIVTRDDAFALRLALLVAHERPQARLVVTIFDRTVAEQLRRAVQGCVVVSMADLVAGPLAASCVSDGARTLRRGVDGIEEIRIGEDGRARVRPRRERGSARVRHWLDRLAGALHPFELSGRILVLGFFGLVTMLAIDVVVGLTALHESFVESLFLGVRTLVAVGPNQALANAADGVKLLSTATMLGALASAAVFTAGLINRLQEPRRVSILGRRWMPRRDHVVVIGLGQVGLRVALVLRDAGIPVVGIERNAAAPGVRLAKRYGLPVIVAEGSDRELMQRLSLRRARALAAVTSDDLGNVAIALAARAVQPDLRVVLRFGDGDIAAETDSLLHVGIVRDAHRLAGAGLAAAVRGWQPGDVVADADGTLLLVGADGRVAPAEPTAT
ncbi:MAG: portal protein [Conexibacter sp.]|nr:portal protein [Conexibacter sp.]